MDSAEDEISVIREIYFYKLGRHHPRASEEELWSRVENIMDEWN